MSSNYHCLLRKGLALAMLSGAALLGLNAHAQTYPSKPIQLVVPFAAGGAADALGRMWGEFVGKSMGTTVVIDNRAGANGSIGAIQASRQPADGYTVFYGGISTLTFNKFSYKKLGYDPDKDFEPVTLLANVPLLIQAAPASGIKTLPELIAKAKAKPGEVRYGSAGKGNSTHLFVALTAEHFGLDLLHVPYKGMAPATIDLLGGQLDFVADVASSTVGNVQMKKVNPVVLFGAKRAAAFPDVPTIAEAGFKDFPVSGWYGLVVPAGTPKAIVDRLDAETRKFWADPSVKAKLDTMMVEPMPAGPGALKAAMAEATRVWGPLITKLQIQND
ncbi:tripartite tricarboxylate transporter substrate binding protein [Variovorax sp. EBFNA2]|uniref:Bug family tripartite tricarboxylate transporter substrate binding protein n=1 Tax=Variovorax sp. EBFNA2 TaxID=3342097 RepID=UPI0029C0E174|nr:tripartite tricarboxylate transporter substrate binding protein [Variovorax boronicumulans]WPG41130.1 tripartite tricarboxylate transporter substrate binding protein [Variovorax boronicumulans]